MIWNYPTRVRFENGGIETLPAELRLLGATRVLVVVDEHLPAALSARVLDVLRSGDLQVELFSGVRANPLEGDAAAGAEAFRRAGADAIVGLGGGSALDAAKLIAVRLASELPFSQLDDALGGDALIPESLVPIVAVPTTAGTGSEVGRAAVVTAADTGRKTVIFHPRLMPRLALLDPELTLGLPPGLTAATGYDALTHNLEALVALGDHPMADGIALEALRLVGRFLVSATQEPTLLPARGAMMKAAMMGAVAFQKGLGACHSLAHPLGSELGLHHGLANALCLPAVVDFNQALCQEPYARAAEALGFAHDVPLAEGLRQFRAELGLPSGLAAVGVTREQLPTIAALALQDGCHQQNPRTCTEADLHGLLVASL